MIHAQLVDLVARIATSLKPQNAVPAGLLNGTCGLALFHAYHFQWSQDERDVHRLNEILHVTAAALGSGTLGASHCGGLAGIAWCLQHLRRHDFVDDDIHDVFSHLEPVLAAEMDRALAASEHDFLHQGLGIVLYFLEQLPDPSAQAQLERAVVRLEATAMRDGELVRWRDHFTSETRGELATTPRFNLGLAHGTPAILAILAKLHRHGIAPERIAPLLRGTVRWLSATRYDGDRTALYPTIVDDHHRALRTDDSRLGWCYGDLGVAVALLHAGTALGDPTILAEARDILHHTLARRTPTNGMVADAGLCHGSVGIAHIYRRAYALTGDEALLVGVDRWLDHTIELANGAIGFASKQANAYVECDDLLQGLAGIGLGLLAAIDRDTEPNWDRCMLFS